MMVDTGISWCSFVTEIKIVEKQAIKEKNLKFIHIFKKTKFKVKNTKIFNSLLIFIFNHFLKTLFTIINNRE